jgi:hypothetical protein
MLNLHGGVILGVVRFAQMVKRASRFALLTEGRGD